MATILRLSLPRRNGGNKRPFGISVKRISFCWLSKVMLKGEEFGAAQEERGRIALGDEAAQGEVHVPDADSHPGPVHEHRPTLDSGALVSRATGQIDAKVVGHGEGHHRNVGSRVEQEAGRKIATSGEKKWPLARFAGLAAGASFLVCRWSRARPSAIR